MSLLTIAIPIQNRSGKRLANNLASLQQQTSNEFDIIIVNYGSDAAHSDSIDSIAREYLIPVITIPVIKNWNKSHALNIALKKTITRYFMSTDVDMIYRPNFIQIVIDQLMTPKVFVSCQCKYLLDRYSAQLTPPFNWEECDRAVSAVSKGGAVGACFAIDTCWLHKVHGWDEFYTGWGKEDQDISVRAEIDHYEQVWITDQTGFYHQYHDDVSSKKDRRLMRTNSDYYWRNSQRDKLIIRNAKQWGINE